MPDPLVRDLNPAQREAVLAAAGPLLVLAGAGTGKTRVVTYRIARLIRHGVSAERILAVTFTNKAAQEMQQRVSQLLGRRPAQRPVISTFHSYCVKILRRHIERLGYPRRFTIYGSGQQESLARRALREVNVPGEALRPADLLMHISRWKSHGVRERDAAALAQSDREHLAAAAYRRYQQALKALGALDFDDLLLCTEALFSRYADARRDEGARFDHILIDEYQDTNASQYRIVSGLAARHRNLCVVGDDDQSIYGWRGAEVEHILRFAQDWPEAKVVRLQQNYRCTPQILEFANRLIRFNQKRHPKVLEAGKPDGERPQILQCEDELKEAAEVVADMRRLLHTGKAEPRDLAILFRTNEQTRPFESELRRCNLPYVLIGGMSFFDRKEIRDALSYLRLIDDPRDELALRRVLNRPPRGIGDSTIKALAACALEHREPLWSMLEHADGVPGVSASAASAARTFVETIERFRRRADQQESPSDLLRGLLTTVDYDRELEREYPETQHRTPRQAAIEDLLGDLATLQKGFRRRPLGELLDELTLRGREDPEDRDKKLKRNAVILLTYHAAKGLEFPNVYLVGMEEGLLPHHRSIKLGDGHIEEERRLCYVGVTRARDRLTLSLALTRRKWGRPRPSDPSRFLFEIVGSADHPHAVKGSQKRPATGSRGRIRKGK